MKRNAITVLLRGLAAELRDEGIPDPIGQPLARWAVWADLCRLAGEPTPREAAERLDGETVRRAA